MKAGTLLSMSAWSPIVFLVLEQLQGMWHVALSK